MNEEILSKCQKMSDYLSLHIDHGPLKRKLEDQISWLEYQARTCNSGLLKENYNWVVSNFNHDLQLLEKEQFPYLS